MSSQYGSGGGDRLGSLDTPANLNGFRVLAALLHGSQVVGDRQTAALNRGRHLYSAGQPSRRALVHILVVTFIIVNQHVMPCVSQKTTSHKYN